ncbi:hypothetical protein [Panacagrimonas sp.]|uniref:hypothetical protein n=1 Tax=Panacagrimonas sp. TaxID=2480088 RepID=UPI003B526F38
MSAVADVTAFAPPSPNQMRRFFRAARWYFNPEFLGLWELDLKRPALFVGIEIIGKVERVHSSFVTGLKHMPVRLRKRGSTAAQRAAAVA